MAIKHCVYQGDRDRQRMMALAQAYPQANLHCIDLPYRFSSWAFDSVETIGLWEDTQGRLVAWAVLQTPFWAIDAVFHPTVEAGVHAQVLEWAEAQAQRVRDSPYGRPIWFINVFDWQRQRQRDLEDHGFIAQTNQGANAWTKVLLKHPHVGALRPAALPEGWTIRPLGGLDEVEAYVALHRAVFESTSMTAAWRARTLQHPEYRPETDMVAINPAGELVAFCIGWFSASGIDGRPCGQIEPLGVRSDMRRSGIGRALLSETVRRLYAMGAVQVIVETDNQRSAALTLYTSVGFRAIENVLVYRKDLPTPVR